MINRNKNFKMVYIHHKIQLAQLYNKINISQQEPENSSSRHHLDSLMN